MLKNVNILVAAAAMLVLTACSKDRVQPGEPLSEEVQSFGGHHQFKKSVILSKAGNIDSAVKRFRDLLGPLSLNETQKDGRREITWDDVALFMTNNNNFPGTYYHRTDPDGFFNQKTGVLLSTPGTGFRVTNKNFADIDTSYRDEFIPFSGAKSIVALESNIINIHFKLPGTDRPGYVNGFGIIFSDVNIEGSTQVALFSGNQFIGNYTIKIADTGEFSFLGVYLPNKKITRARIKLGQAPIGKGRLDVCDSPNGSDLVSMDNLIFSYPKRF